MSCLNLSNTKVTDDGIERLFAGNDNWSQSLTELRLDNCPQITDYAIEIVLEVCKKLNIFLFHACPKTTERSLTALERFLRLHSTKGDVKQTTWTIY